MLQIFFKFDWIAIVVCQTKGTNKHKLLYMPKQNDKIKRKKMLLKLGPG